MKGLKLWLTIAALVGTTATAVGTRLQACSGVAGTACAPAIVVTGSIADALNAVVNAFGGGQ